MKTNPILPIALLIYSLSYSVSVRSEVFVKSLRDANTIKIETLKNKKIVTALFKEDCGPCRLQTRSLTCLPHDYTIILLGAFASELSLKRELRWHPKIYNAYFADQSVIQYLGVKSKATPQIFYFNNSSKPLSFGFTKCEIILRKIKKMES